MKELSLYKELSSMSELKSTSSSEPTSKSIYSPESSDSVLEEYLKEIRSDISYGVERKVLLRKLEFSFGQILKQEGAFIAGGAITSLFCDRPINDIDIFFRTEEGYKNTLERIRSTGPYNGMHESNNAVTFNNLFNCPHPVQLINMGYYPNPIDVFNDFDFSVCCGLYDFTEDKFHFGTDFFKHNSQRKLAYNVNNNYPLMTMIRSEKYKKMGYSLSNTELLKVLFKITSLNIKTNKEALQQITGFYLNLKTTKSIREVLSNDDPFDINIVSDLLGSFSYSPLPDPSEKKARHGFSYAEAEERACSSSMPVTKELPDNLPF